MTLACFLAQRLNTILTTLFFLQGLDELLASTESKTEGWPASYGYSMDEFEWAMFDG